MNINLHLEKHKQHFSVTAFPKIVGNFLQEDILQYKDNVHDLSEKLLLLEKCRFWAFSEQQTCRNYESPSCLNFTGKVNS